jgi:hypothetical protein
MNHAAAADVMHWDAQLHGVDGKDAHMYIGHSTTAIKSAAAREDQPMARRFFHQVGIPSSSLPWPSAPGDAAASGVDGKLDFRLLNLASMVSCT